ncbi:MAG: MraY family glycosyltransferase [Planctomycetota bacterium]
MTQYMLIAVLAATFAWCLTPWVRRVALASGILDYPGGRKVHLVSTPRFGGVAIYLAFLLTALGVYWYRELAAPSFPFDVVQFSGLMLGGTGILLVGIYDDLFGLRAGVKLGLEVLVALIVAGIGIRIETITIPGVGLVELGFWAIPATVLWIVGIANAFNLIDGIDGLSAGTALIASTISFLIAIYLGRTEVALYFVVLAGSTLGFLRYNYNPAQVFLGDSGSLFLGYTLAVASVLGLQKSSTIVSILVPVLALGLPIADVALAVIRRYVRAVLGQKGRDWVRASLRFWVAFEPDKEHIHHRLLGIGFSHRQAVHCLYLAGLFLGVLAYLMTALQNRGIAVILIYLGIVTALGVRKLGFLRPVGADLGRRTMSWKRLPNATMLALDPAGDVARRLGEAAADRGWSLVCAKDPRELAELAGGRNFVACVVPPRYSETPEVGALRSSRPYALWLAAPAEGEAIGSNGDWFDVVGTDANASRAMLGRVEEVAALRNRLRYFKGLFWLTLIWIPIIVFFLISASFERG